MHRQFALAALVIAALAACATPATTTTTTTPTSSPSPTELPIEGVVASGALEIRAVPFADFATALDGLVWVSGVYPGIVAYDATSGSIVFEVATAQVWLAMESGFGSIWAVEAAGRVVPDTLVRVDAATGAVLARYPLPASGVLSESSVAVTDSAVWVLVGEDGSPEPKQLVGVDPATGAVLRTVQLVPSAAAVRGGFGSLWVTAGDRTVLRIDPASGETIATIETGVDTRFAAVGPDAVWVMSQSKGSVIRIDPITNTVVATIVASSRAVNGGDLAAGENSVWLRSSKELAVEIDPATNEVVRRIGPAAGSGSIAIVDGAVWITVHDDLVIYRVPTG